MKNFLRLGGLSILSVQYMYIDHKNYLADFLLAQNHVSVHFGDEFSREDSPYRIICLLKSQAGPLTLSSYRSVLRYVHSFPQKEPFLYLPRTHLPSLPRLGCLLFPYPRIHG